MGIKTSSKHTATVLQQSIDTVEQTEAIDTQKG